MNKFAAISFAAVAALASTSAFAFFDTKEKWEEPECWYNPHDCNPYDEWDPRYWMEEFEQMWDDDDYGYGGYGMPFGGPMGGYGMPYGGPMGGYGMPYGGGAPMMGPGGYGMPYGAPMMRPPMAPQMQAPQAAPQQAPQAAPQAAPRAPYAAPYAPRMPYAAPARPAPAPAAPQGN